MPVKLPPQAIIAHRGSSIRAPENTMAAFELAIQEQAEGIELDVKLTGDGQVVVMHDQTLNRTTNGSGDVAQTKLADILKLDAGSFHSPQYAGEPPPSLDQVLEQIGGRIPINIELTNYASRKDDLPDKVAALVKKHGLENDVFFSSFNPTALKRIHALLPHAPVGFLIFEKGIIMVYGKLMSKFTYHDSLNVEFKTVSPQLIRSAHAKGKQILPYTVNNAKDLQHMYDLGVDAVITDDPILARQVRAGGKP